MKDATTESVVYAFLHGYVSHLVPGSVTTDRGSQFKSGMRSQLLSFLGCLRKRTTSFYPQCIGLIENFHRRLKDALRLQQYPNRWYYNLPLVLLTIRSTRNTIKQEINCSPAELTFGQNMVLPGEFSIADSTPAMLQHDLVKHLKKYFSNIHAAPTRPHEVSLYIDSNLQTCSHVWIRCDGRKLPFRFRYSGPYRAIKRNAKFFTLNVKDSLKTVSVDRLKVAYSPSYDKDIDVNANVVSSTDNSDGVPSSETITGRYTLRGRKINFPSRLHDFALD